MASSNHCAFFQKGKEIQKIKTDKDSILLSLWIDLYHIQMSDTEYWIWNIWTVSHVLKAHADGTGNNWNDESNQQYECTNW
jgi:hypothetical protein